MVEIEDLDPIQRKVLDWKMIADAADDISYTVVGDTQFF
jgi:hypothetical protein